MHLKRLSILNYKSCQGISVELQKDCPTIFIGMNDAGKSALLKSLSLLLDSKAQINPLTQDRSTSDISNTPLKGEKIDEIFKIFDAPNFDALNDGTVVLGEFVLEENEVTESFIESASAQLKWAIESRNDNSILLLKHFDHTNPGGKYYLCLGDSNPSLALWSKKASDLQVLVKENEISKEEISNENGKGRFANFELLKAVYKKIGFGMSWAEFPTYAKGDCNLFPTYRYIDWNTSLGDVENLATDVMKDKIEDSRSSLITQATTLSTQATEEVNKEFETLMGQLTADLPNISSIKAKVAFSVSEKVSDIIINKATSDGDIRLDSQGEGVKRQILFAFLKWASMKSLAKDDPIKRFIWCFDEPEAHLYPSAQRDLYAIIATLAKGNYQVLLGTHSTIFIDRLRLREIYKIKLNDKYSEILNCDSIDDVYESLGVRNSDILFFDHFLAVEGESEEVLIPHLYKVFTGKTLEEDAIKLIPLGGSGHYINNKTILESILSDFRKTDSIVNYVLDADTGMTGDNVLLLGTCDLEDLLPNSLWIRLVKEECDIDLSESDLDGLRTQLDASIADKKFHKLLGSMVALHPGHKAYLPSKRMSAQIFQTYITEVHEVPTALVDLFTAIRPQE